MPSTEDSGHLLSTEESNHLPWTEDRRLLLSTEDRGLLSSTGDIGHLLSAEHRYLLPSTEECGHLLSTEYGYNLPWIEIVSFAISKGVIELRNPLNNKPDPACGFLRASWSNYMWICLNGLYFRQIIVNSVFAKEGWSSAKKTCIGWMDILLRFKHIP